jgi:hypothetical protein
LDGAAARTARIENLVLPAGFSGDVGLFIFVLQPATGLPLLHSPMDSPLSQAT